MYGNTMSSLVYIHHRQKRIGSHLWKQNQNEGFIREKQTGLVHTLRVSKTIMALQFAPLLEI